MAKRSKRLFNSKKFLGLKTRFITGRSAYVSPDIKRVNEIVLEDAEAGDLAATLSVINSPPGVSWTFTLGEGAPSEFAIDESDSTLLEVDGSLDYESVTSYEVPIVATSDEDPATVLTRTITILITNVVEAPVFLSAPVVTGELDGILTCSTGTLVSPDGDGSTFEYQWKDADDGDPLGGETNNTLDTQSYIGLDVYCTVTATNSADSTAEDSNVVGTLTEA
jgi:hypothetical protein